MLNDATRLAEQREQFNDDRRAFFEALGRRQGDPNKTPAELEKEGQDRAGQFFQRQAELEAGSATCANGSSVSPCSTASYAA